METLLRIGLSNAVAAVLLALVVAVVACVWRRPALLHALWLLVLIKLVTPPLLWLPEPWAAPAAPPAVAEKSPDLKPIEFPPDAAPERTGAAAAAAPSLVFDLTAIPAPEPELEAAPSDPEALPTLAAPAPAPALPWWLTTAAGAWLAGAAGWYALAVCRLRRFRRLLRHATPAPESLRQRTQRLAEKMGLRRPPAVWLVPGRVAPMLWAAGGRPRILFPSDLLELVGVEGQNALLVHELAHLRRRDHWVRWLEFAAAGLYWWHPVLWFARRELREAEELCCDAWVTATLLGAGKTYAAALLETLDFLSDSPPAAPVLASGVGRVADLKRRLTMIMRGTTPKSLGWRGLLAVLGTGLLMLPLLPAWAQAQVAAPPPVVAPPPAPVPPPAAAPGGDPDNARAALKAAEAELEQKQAEVAALSAKVQQLRARLKAEQAAAPAAPPGKDWAVVQGGKFVVAVNPETDPKAVQELLKKLQVTRLPEGKEMIVVDAESGRIIMKVEDGKSQVVGKGQLIVVPIGSPGGTAGPAAGVGGAPPAADSDKRIDELEQRLKGILDEVEKLRREHKNAAPEGGAAAPAAGAPAVLDKIPYLKWVFTNDAAAQEKLARAMADQAAKAKAEAEAERKDAEEKVKKLEEENRKLKGTPAGTPPAPESKAGPKDADEAFIALSTADSYFGNGRYEKALNLYSEAAERFPKEEQGVSALAGCVRCLMALGRKDEVGKRVQEIKARLNILPSDEQQRWKEWLDVAAKLPAP